MDQVHDRYVVKNQFAILDGKLFLRKVKTLLDEIYVLVLHFSNVSELLNAKIYNVSELDYKYNFLHLQYEQKISLLWVPAVMLLLPLYGCSATRYVPDGNICCAKIS